MVHLNEGRDPSPPLPPSNQGTTPRVSRFALVSQFLFSPRFSLPGRSFVVAPISYSCSISDFFFLTFKKDMMLLIWALP